MKQQPTQSSFIKRTYKNWLTTEYYEKGMNFDKCKNLRKWKPSNESVHMAVVLLQRLSVLSNIAVKASSVLAFMTLEFNWFHLHIVSRKIYYPNV